MQHTRSGLLIALAACAATAIACSSPTAQPTAPNASAPGAAVASAKPAAPMRVARPFGDPAAGVTFRVSQYWDYERDTPFEVEDYVARGGSDRDKDNKLETVITADVKLPATAAQRKLGLLAAPEEVDEEIDPEEDDVENEDDWVVDADGDGEYEEDEDDDYEEEYDEAEEDALLASPHRVKLEVEDEPFMSDDDDTLWLTDETTDDEVVITHDQEWQNFEITSEAGTLEVAFNPDGTYTIDGEPAADAAAAVVRLAEHRVIQEATPQMIGLLTARLGRLPGELSRSAGVTKCTDPPRCGCPSCYRVLSTGDRPVRRAFGLLDALMIELTED